MYKVENHGPDLEYHPSTRIWDHKETYCDQWASLTVDESIICCCAVSQTNGGRLPETKEEGNGMFSKLITDPQLSLRIVETIQNDVLQEAERDRLMQEVNPASPALQDQVLAGVGGLLISLGTKLQGQQMSTQTK
jgi:hypothetical protein